MRYLGSIVVFVVGAAAVGLVPEVYIGLMAAVAGIGVGLLWPSPTKRRNDAPPKRRRQAA